MLARTFGCIRVVWNRTLADRHARYAVEGKSTSYAQTDAALTAMKKTPELEWLNEVSSVPLQQTLRHQYKAFQAFSQKRARYPRFKSRYGRQSATYTRSAFSMRGGQLRLAKTTAPLAFVWSWPDVLGMRASARGAEPEHPDVAVPVLPHPARPGHQRGGEHSCGRSCRSRGQPRRCLRS